VDRHNPRRARLLEDTHPADIIARLVKAGWTLRSLAAHHDLSHRALTQALRFSYPASERRIAEALGVEPEAIWPARYAKRRADASKRAKARNVKNAEAR
jgi:Ner family transcriptional regulator